MTSQRIPNEHYTERGRVTFDHAALTAGIGRIIHVATRPEIVKAARYVNETGLAADGTNYASLDVRRDGAADALTFTPATFTTTHGTETVNLASHGLLTGDGPFRLTNSGGALPAGYALATDYYVIKTAAGTLKLAASRALAFIGTAVAISGDGTGTHTISAGTGCRRPVTIADGVNTNNVGGAALAADAAVTLTLATDGTKLVLAAGDVLRCCVAVGGSPTLPAGRLELEFDAI